ncbi:MAG TPA: sigma-70 family RNA polymerase sigma factor [Acidobacteriaceae bacterium]|jgi:RNA polymerase sigma-70 factor (ECF subfamily)|nr:sigma-70 family RNA polymerase sigma factor [Acidobacteriaceae bacterium]
METEFFEQMAMPLFDQLYNLAHWLTGDRADAEDLVQETYAKALKGFQSFQAGTNLRAWMYRILRNAFLNSRAGLAAQKTSYLGDDSEEMIDVTAHSITPEILLLQQESQETVMSALASIPAAHREIILLCEIEELSYQEISQVLSVPVGTVMSRLSRARKLLRQTIQMKFPVRCEDAL